MLIHHNFFQMPLNESSIDTMKSSFHLTSGAGHDWTNQKPKNARAHKVTRRRTLLPPNLAPRYERFVRSETTLPAHCGPVKNVTLRRTK
jgi:hypothetical protein